MAQGTIETEDLRQADAANWGQLESYLKLKSPNDSPFKVERRSELLQALESTRKTHQINPIFILALAIHESGWGRSNIARVKNNLFGWGAFDRDPFNGAWTFRDYADCCDVVMGKIKASYLTSGGAFFEGASLKGMNVHYSTDRQWATGVRTLMNEIDRHISSIQPPEPPPLTELGTLSRYLQVGPNGSEGSIGDDVLRLQTALAALDLYHGPLDSEFGPLTEEAVKKFQLQRNLEVDGVVGPDTWTALGGRWETPNVDERRVRLAQIALEEGRKNLSWSNSSSKAEKYLAPLREPMRRKRQIGSSPVFYDWCGAFVLWCHRQAGYDFPEFLAGEPSNHWATFALVQTWYDWARSKGYWHPRRGFLPEPGDIILFDWSSTRGQFNHIGIVRNYTSGNTIETSEGNSGNRTVNQSRNLSTVLGFIRIQ